MKITRKLSELKFNSARKLLTTVILLGSLFASFVETTASYAAQPYSITVTRSLPASVSPGQTFNVSVTFAAPASGFDTIGLSDFAPQGWVVAVDKTLCSPVADQQNVTSNRIDYIWYSGPYNAGAAFTAVYHVTVPANVSPGIYTFTNSSPNPRLEYYVSGQGPFDDNIVGSNQVNVVPSASLTITSTTGGTVNQPGVGTFNYPQGTVVNLVAVPGNGYSFTGWTGDNATIAKTSSTSTNIILNGNYTIQATFKSGCFIATAAYGSPNAEQIDVLRTFRDKILMSNRVGAAFVAFYYRVSPPIADFISQHEFVRTIVRKGFVDPIVNVVRHTQIWWGKY